MHFCKIILNYYISMKMTPPLIIILFFLLLFSLSHKAEIISITAHFYGSTIVSKFPYLCSSQDITWKLRTNWKSGFRHSLKTVQKLGHLKIVFLLSQFSLASSLCIVATFWQQNEQACSDVLHYIVSSMYSYILSMCTFSPVLEMSAACWVSVRACVRAWEGRGSCGWTTTCCCCGCC